MALYPYYSWSSKIDNIEIVHKNENFIIFNKPNGLLTHPTANSEESTLRDYLVELYPDVLTWGEPKREGIVHRLDKVTSGLLLCPLKEEIFKIFKEKFKTREIKKIYTALVQGTLPFDSGLIQVPLSRSKQNRSKRAVDRTGRESITKYELIDYSVDLNISKLELELVTGRNHQIRAHMEYMKTPVLNDELYGSSKNNNIPHNAIALHSTFLQFEFEKEIFAFSTEPPSFFNQVLDV